MGDRSACDGRDASEAVEVSEQRADVPVHLDSRASAFERVWHM